jgi:hypothetical protein
LWLLLVCADRLSLLASPAGIPAVDAGRRDVRTAGAVGLAGAVIGLVVALTTVRSAAPVVLRAATEPGAKLASSEFVTGARPPYPAPGWRWATERYWYNDLSTESFRRGDRLPVIPAPGEYEYRAAFDDGAARWHALDNTMVPQTIRWNTEGYAESVGPWPAEPKRFVLGTGGLHLVAFLYTGDLRPAAHSRLIDFTSAALSIKLRGHDVDLRGGKLVVWVQHSDGDKAVNLALVGKPLNRAVEGTGWSTVDLPLAPGPDWQCITPPPALADYYECKPAADVLRDVNRRIGLIIYPAPNGVATGAIDIDDVTLGYRLSSRE